MENLCSDGDARSDGRDARPAVEQRDPEQRYSRASEGAIAIGAYRWQQ